MTFTLDFKKSGDINLITLAIVDFEGIPFKKVDPKLTTSGYFFLVDPDQ